MDECQVVENQTVCANHIAERVIVTLSERGWCVGCGSWVVVFCLFLVAVSLQYIVSLNQASVQTSTSERVSAVCSIHVRENEWVGGRRRGRLLNNEEVQRVTVFAVQFEVMMGECPGGRSGCK